MEFAERLKIARERVGLSQSELGRRLHISAQSVQQWEKEGGTTPRNKRLDEIARILGVTRSWLLVGGDLASNVRVMTSPMREVPIVNYVQAGCWAEIAPDMADAKTVTCPVPCSPQSFALEVIGESMAPEYMPGDVIFIDPEVAASSGDDVVAILDDQGEATFKRLVAEPGSKRLKAINPEWSPRYTAINGNCHIVGTVIYAGRDPRRRKR